MTTTRVVPCESVDGIAPALPWVHVTFRHKDEGPHMGWGMDG